MQRTAIVLIVFATVLAGFAVVLAPPEASAAAPAYILYGNAANGWSLTNASGSFSSPGPALTVTAGQTVMLKLVSADGLKHDFFVDLNNNLVPDAGEPLAQSFTGTIYFNLTLNTAGSFTYRCEYHPTVMRGAITVQPGSTTTTPPPPDYTLYAALIIVVAIVAVIAAVLVRRRPRSPGRQPPEQTPPPR